MTHWSLDDIPWQAFDATKVDPELLALIKAASLVEYNGADYARYLREVFTGEPEKYDIIDRWAGEEVQHGMALRKWAELADPAFDFERSFKAFTTGYKLPSVTASVRGSLSGEMIARCVVEAGTSNYYMAIREFTGEPVLKAICAKLSADEHRHYKLFYDLHKQYQVKERLGVIQRIRVAVGRMAESDDDELAYAYYAANTAEGQAAYDRKLYTRRYMCIVARMYRKQDIRNMMAMIFKAVGLKPHTLFHRFSSLLAWNVLRLRTH